MDRFTKAQMEAERSSNTMKAIKNAIEIASATRINASVKRCGIGKITIAVKFMDSRFDYDPCEAYREAAKLAEIARGAVPVGTLWDLYIMPSCGFEEAFNVE